MSAPRQPMVPSELHPLSMVRMFWKRKILVGVVWILGSAAAVAVVWKLPPVYKAEALIVVDSQKIPERYVSSTVSTEIQDRIATIGEQITSSGQLKKIIDDFGLYKDQRGTLSQEEILDRMRVDITVKLEKGWIGNRPGAFRVGYQGSDPATVAQVANRLANLYIEENLRVREVQAEGTSEFMETQLSESKKRLDELESAISQYKLKHNGELPQQENHISSELARGDLALQANREAIRRAEESRKILLDALSMAESTVTSFTQPRPVSGGDVATQGASASAITSPQASGAAPKKSEFYRIRLEALHDAGYADGHPDVRWTKEELATALVQEAKEQASQPKQTAVTAEAPKSSSGRPSVPPVLSTERERALEQAKEHVATVRAQIDALGREIQERNADQQKILQTINALQTRLGSLPIREQEMSGLTRDYEISKANYKSLLDKRMAAEMSTDMERRQKSERFTLLDPARTPEKPAKPNRPLFAGLGSLGALLLGALLGFGLEFRQNCILGEWELPKGVVVLGRVPIIEPRTAFPGSGKPSTPFFRRWVLALTSVFLLAVLAAGFYVVRNQF